MMRRRHIGGTLFVESEEVSRVVSFTLKSALTLYQGSVICLVESSRESWSPSPHGQIHGPCFPYFLKTMPP